MRILRNALSFLWWLFRVTVVSIIWLPYVSWDTMGLSEENRGLYRSLLFVSGLLLLAVTMMVFFAPFQQPEKHPFMVIIFAYMILGFICDQVIRFWTQDGSIFPKFSLT